MFPKQNCPVCQNRAYYDTNGALTLRLHLQEALESLQEAMKSEARLLEENEKLVNEITKLKERLTYDIAEEGT